jgi:hypothetical protein
VTSQSVNSYTLSVRSKTGNTFSIARAADGSVARCCSRTGGTTKGGCPSSNRW